jgi:xylulokinase
LDWAPDRIAEYRLPPKLLPEVLPWGAEIGELKAEVAEEWGFPKNVAVAQGCHDSNCSALGAGVSETGTACLVSGSYENLLVITNKLPTLSLLRRGLSVMPQPCPAGLSVIAVHPTGTAVLNWSRDLVDLTIDDLDTALRGRTVDPGPVMAVPYLSGAMTYWEGGRKAKGALLGLTLATSKADLVQAFMESIAYDLVNTLSLLGEEGIEVNSIRITGGGSRSAWWTQLKSDLVNKPIEVVEQKEPGTFGAALLAGYALGVYHDLESTSKELSRSKITYTPHPERYRAHEQRLEAYKRLMALLLEHIY